MNMTTSPMQYLDKAMNTLHELGLVPTGDGGQEAPIIVLLNLISDLDEARVAAIARTLDKASLFNDVVREQVQAMEVGESPTPSTVSVMTRRRWSSRSRMVIWTPSSGSAMSG